MGHKKSEREAYLLATAKSLAVLVLVLGVGGFLFSITQTTVEPIVTVTNCALISLAGAALLSFLFAWPFLLWFVSSLLVAMVSAATLLHSLVVEQPLTSWYASPSDSAAFFFLGLALLSLRLSSHTGYRLHLTWVLATLFVGFLGFAGNLLHAEEFHRTSAATLYTSLGIVLVSVGLLFSQPPRGVARILSQGGTSGSIARWSLPVSFALPLSMGYALLWGQRIGLYESSYSVALFASGLSVIFSLFVLWGSYSRGLIEEEQQLGLQDERFQFTLGELLRPIGSPEEALQIVSCSLGDYLKVSRCFLLEITHDKVIAHPGFYGDLTPLPPELPLEALSPEVLQTLRQGNTIVIGDLEVNPMTASRYQELYGPLGMRAQIVVPMLRAGKLVATLVVSQQSIRHWSQREQLLCQLSVEKAWLWFEYQREAKSLVQREKELAESEARYRELYENSPDMHVSVNTEGTIKDCNQTLCKNLGYVKEELLGKSFIVLYHSSITNLARETFRRFQAEGRIRNEERLLSRKDTTPMEVSLNADAVTDAAGNLVGGHAVFRDISGQKQLEKMKERDRFFHLSTDLVCILKDNTFIQVNPAFTTTLGWTAEELTSRPYASFVHPEDLLSTAERAMAMIADSNLPGRFTNRYQCRDGSYRWLQWRGTPDEDGSWYAIARDVTLEKEAEQTLQKKQEELSASLREREVLLQEVHHRVKNNLQIVSSLLNMQLRQTTDTNSRAALLECKSRIETIALIHEQLYQSNNYSEIHFSAYIKQLAGQIIRSTNERGRIELELDIDDIPLAVDKAIPCGLILNELLINATKYAFPDRSGKIKISLHQQGQKIEVSVSDDGVGLPQDWSLEATKGLGTTLVRALVKQLDGLLTTTHKSGTAFHIVFQP